MGVDEKAMRSKWPNVPEPGHCASGNRLKMADCGVDCNFSA